MSKTEVVTKTLAISSLSLGLIACAPESKPSEVTLSADQCVPVDKDKAVTAGDVFNWEEILSTAEVLGVTPEAVVFGAILQVRCGTEYDLSSVFSAPILLSVDGVAAKSCVIVGPVDGTASTDTPYVVCPGVPERLDV